MPSSSSLSGLIKWLGRPGWAEAFEDVWWLHTGAACEAVGIDQDEIGDILGDGYAVTLWGCAFEDFLTRTLEPDGRNIVDEYLKRRGWKETATARRYMQALRGSVMSLYEVSDIVPGEALLARDLVRGGEPVRVSERTATRTLAPWERIGARIVVLNGTHIIAGGLLPFTQDASDEVIRALRTEKGRARRVAASSPGEAGPLDLQDAAPLFTGLWLGDVLSRVLNPDRPTVLNTDGDEISFHSVSYPLLDGVTSGQVEGRLSSAEALRDAGGAVWNWIENGRVGAGPARKAAAVGARDADVTLGVTLDDGGLVSGTVAIVDDALVLSTNSSARAERGRELLTPLLEGLVGAATTEVQSVDEAIASRAEGGPAPADDIPADVLVGIVHESLDRHYRDTFDRPVGMLGGKTPRTCARSKAGRDRLAEWLKFLERENGRVGHGESDPMRSYDFGWMWDELGIADLRR